MSLGAFSFLSFLLRPEEEPWPLPGLPGLPGREPLSDCERWLLGCEASIARWLSRLLLGCDVGLPGVFIVSDVRLSA